MAIGSKSARMTLAEGLAFLTSAMSWIGPGPARAARKSRTGGASAAWASISSSGIRDRAAATSRRFEATISSRIEAASCYLNASRRSSGTRSSELGPRGDPTGTCKRSAA